jgi:integrase
MIQPPTDSVCAFIAFAKSCGVEGATYHRLRHSFGSLLMANGTIPLTVSKMAGHSEVSFTMQRYGHLLPGMQEAAAASLDAVFAHDTKPAA